MKEGILKKFISMLLVFVLTLSLVSFLPVSTSNVSQTVAKASESCGTILHPALYKKPFTTSNNGSKNPDIMRTFADDKGHKIDEIVTSGKPLTTKSIAVTVPMSNPATGTNVLSNVPAFDYSYGCSATSAAMLFGYYDNNGYSNMYTGPTNGGVCPMNNSVWGHTTYSSVTCGECPLSATHNGIDGRMTGGHVDDYWIDYGNPGPDPYIVNGWTEHTSDCTGDFMGSNQSKYGNVDGETDFYFDPSGDPLYDYTGDEPNSRDGCHGMLLFAESRGYTVTTNFFQCIKGYGSDPNKGFTFDDFKNEIDSGRPVLIQVTNHTMLGYGYNTTGQIIYIHDTWDYSDHQMTWGGTYAGFQQYGVVVIHLSTTPLVPPSLPSLISPTNGQTVNTTTPTFQWSNVSADKYEMYIRNSSGTQVYDNNIASISIQIPSGYLFNGNTYYWKVRGYNTTGWGNWSSEWSFTVTLQFTIIASAGSGGSIFPSGIITVNSGDSKTFTITLNSGYKVSDVKVDGVSVGSISSYTFTNITSNHTIETAFEKEITQTVIILQIGNTNFTVNGVSNTLDSPPVIKNGITLVPIRAIVEALGGTISWDSSEKKVTITLKGTIIELWIGKNTASVNGVNTPIDSTNTKIVPEIINSRTMLPLRFVTEQLGAMVDWNSDMQTITITYGG